MNIKRFSKALVLASIAVVALATACSPMTLSIPSISINPTPAATDTPAATPTVSSQNNSNANAKTNIALPANLKSLGLEAGVVTANTGSMLSLRIAKTMEQLAVTSGTLIAVPGKTNAQVSDIRVGDRVIADVGQSDTSAPARFVLDVPKGYTFANVLAGAVVNRDQSGILVRARGGDQQINPGPSMVIINMTGNQVQLGIPADVRKGTGVLVVGQPAKGSMTAQIVVVIDRATIQSRRNNPVPTPTVTP